MLADQNGTVSAAALQRAVAAIFVACGIGAEPADRVAEDLVAADIEGVASHGVMLVPMYVQRLKAGSVSLADVGVIISDRQASVVLDAQDALGQLTARQAVDLAIARAREFGMGVVAIRNAFHFGTAGRYARMMADQGAVGIVMSNTRPLMPAPGGAQPLTGNNPLAIAVPSGSAFAPEVDMALSAAAMGKIRNAAAAGQPIPQGWAADKDGNPTTDPHSAIAGMLLPAAGPKGFGLAFMIDLLTGGLSGGAIGPQVNGLYGDPAAPYRCSNLFIAIDVGHFVPVEDFGVRTASELDRVARSKAAPGVQRVFAPGEMAYAARQKSAGRAPIASPALSSLIETGASLGLDLPSYF